MSWGNRVCATIVAASLVLLLSAPAIAPAKALKPISGKLSKPGYTVIALTPSGKARAVSAKRGRFRLRPPGPFKPTAGFTLQLRGPDGTYAGPIVIAHEKKGKRAILGVRSGAKLGKVRIASGYAMLREQLAQKLIDGSLWARTRKGVPIGAAKGAGKAGLVRSKHTKGGAPGDSDLDGVPNTLDIDDDGDLILDDYDRSTHRRVSQTASSSSVHSENAFELATDLSSGLLGPVNVNGGSSEEQIAAVQQNGGILSVFWDIAGDEIDPGSGELDCGTLTYCSTKDGTGRFRAVSSESRDTAAPFPECCDSDHDGLGSLTSTQLFPGSEGGTLMELFHGATTDQIRAGDVLIERATVHGEPVQYAASVGFVFSTVPALATYDDGQGDSATFTYPRATTMCVPGQAFDPASSCPLPVRAGPDGNVVVKLTFWRPQRRRVEGEPGEGKWMDVGNLVYDTMVQLVGPSAPGGECPTSSFSGVDPNLTSVPPSPGPMRSGVWFADVSGDRPSNPANTFTYTLNLTDCLASRGISFPSSEPVIVQLMATAQHEFGTSQITFTGITFKLEP